jgi:hypothetical protein
MSIIAIHNVGKENRMTDEIDVLKNGRPGKEPEPMELVVGRAGEHDESDGGKDNGREENPEPHLGFSNAIILSGSPGGEAVTEGTYWEGIEDADEVAEGV